MKRSVIAMALALAATVAMGGDEHQNHLIVAARSDLQANVWAKITNAIQTEAGIRIETNMPLWYDAANNQWRIAAIWRQHLRPTFTKARFDTMTNGVSTMRCKAAWTTAERATATLTGFGLTNGVSKLPGR